MKKLNCPSCGGDVVIDPKTGVGVCKACGTKIQTVDYTEVKTKRIVDEARIKEAEVNLKNLEIQETRRKEKIASDKEKELHKKKVKKFKIIFSSIALAIALVMIIVAFTAGYENGEFTGLGMALAYPGFIPAIAGVIGFLTLIGD